MGRRCIWNRIVILSMGFLLLGCGGEGTNVTQPKIEQDSKTSVVTDHPTSHEPSLPIEQLKAYQSAASPCAVEAGATKGDMRGVLLAAENFFQDKSPDQMLSGEQKTVETVDLKVGAKKVTMIYRGSSRKSAQDLPVVVVGFGPGPNAIVSHGILWYQNGKWNSQPYPQAGEAAAKNREGIQTSGFCSGGIVQIVQQGNQGNMMAVVNNLGLGGTHAAEEVQLLEFADGVWKVAWVPTYDDPRILWDSNVEMKGSLDSFVVHRHDQQHPDRTWDEHWKLEGKQYVMN